MTEVLRSYATHAAAKEDLKDHVEPNQLTALNQALSDAFGDKGKNSGYHAVEEYGEKHILHASAGKVGKGDGGVTLFFFMDNGVFRLIALGQHEKNGYKIDKTLGQNQSPFQKKKLVSATGAG